MKRFLITCIFCLVAFSCSGNTKTEENSVTLDTISVQLRKIENHIWCNTLSNRYKLYQTENIYNLLKLDTKTGRIWLIQWSLDEDKEFTTVVNPRNFALFDYDDDDIKGIGRFELYPTKNMWQFILLDKAVGRTWHVQWGLEEQKRWIVEIK